MPTAEPWRLHTWRPLGVVVAGLLLCSQSQAQRWEADTLTATRDTLLLRHANLVPGRDTLWADGAGVERGRYRLLSNPGRLVLLDSSLRGRQLVLRGLAFAPLPSVIAPLPGVRIASPRGGVQADGGGGPGGAAQPPLPRSGSAAEGSDAGAAPPEARNLFADVPRLERSGSIGRAVTLGSNRDLAVNSDFRLQLSGQLTDDLEIAAALTDENIPIQPSGSTQQLSDFDRIFIQLKQRNRYVTFGDLEVIQRGTTFSNLYRNVQGLAVRQSGDRRWYATVANAKGRFHSNSFAGENARQGPYRLQGRDGERFMTLLAGSERVYVNGVLKTRGQGRDYVIDYNTAELTFTPRVVIDANTRIVVDFEYQVQQYARSLIFGSYEGRHLGDKLGLRFSYGREADDPDAALLRPLNELERSSLSQAGDNGTVGSGVDSVGYTPIEVRYERVDTTINLQAVTFYRRSTDPIRAVYRVTFSFVGARRGNYVRDAAQINGNVFRFVAPDALGNLQGDYEPVRPLAAPRQLQMVSLTADYRLSRRLSAFTETAVSDEDRNRLSSLNDDDNLGVATRTGLRLSGLPLGSRWQLGSEVVGQYVDASFENFDRVYRYEYGREWNFNDLGARAIERLGELSTELRQGSRYRFRVAGGVRSMGDSLRTDRLTLEGESSDSSALLGTHKFVWLQTTNPKADIRSSWARHNGDVYVLLGPRARRWFRLGSEIWIEHRRQTQADTLTLGSFDFADLKPYVRSLVGRKLQFEVGSTLRSDREFLAGRLRDKAVTLKPTLSLGYQPHPRWNSSLTATYLDYRLRDTAFVRVGLSSQQALQSQLQTSYTTPNQLLQSAFTYEVSTERIARRQLVYVKVNAGLGQYEWIDYNGNGVEDLNEFEVSTNPLTANYVRILTPTSELEPTVRAALGGNLRFDFSRVAAAGGPFARRLLHALSTQTNFRLDQRRRAPTDELQSYLVQLVNPERADSTLLSALLSLRQDLFFFRNNRIGDFSFSLLVNQNLQFLNSGSEERSSTTWQARQRLNLDSRRSLDNVIQLGSRRSRAELQATRNFDLDLLSVQPSFNLQASRRLRMTAGYELGLRHARVQLETEEARLTAHKLLVDARLGFGERNNLTTRLEVLDNALRGEPNASARFELLEGLQPGRNLVWNLMIVQYLSRILEFSFVYDGRAAANLPMIHSARIQLRALF